MNSDLKELIYTLMFNLLKTEIYVLICFVTFVLLLTACAKEHNEDFKKNEDKICNYNGGNALIVVKSDSLCIFNGGGSPSDYEKFYGKRIYSMVDEEIVLVSYIELNTEIKVLTLNCNDNGFVFENPNNIYLYKGDSLFISKEGTIVRWKKI